MQGEESKEGMYLAIILPGSAMLTVHSLPSVGWNIAVGLEVSISVVFEEEGRCMPLVPLVPLGAFLASDWRLRF